MIEPGTGRTLPGPPPAIWESTALMPRRRSRSAPALRSSRRITDVVIETAWLVGLVSVPLVFNPRNWLTFYNDPKYVALHIAALVIVAAWAWERAVYPETAGLPGLSEARRWIGRRPERWALVAAGALASVAMLSALASPARLVSFWGRDFTDLGYELYSFLSLLVIFFAVAMRTRTEAQVRRILFAFAGVGTVAALYAIVQQFDLDTIGPGLRGGRVFGTFGNAIHLGSFLVMSTILTMALALVELRGGKYRWFVIGAVALGLQLMALWFAGSRGPWIGFAGGVIAFTVIGFMWLDRRTISRSLPFIAIGAVVVFVIVLAPVPGANQAASRSLGDLGSIFDETLLGAFGGRAPIWESALELSGDRDWAQEDSAAGGVKRSLLGYGPEMFFYAYPLGLEVDRTSTFAQHAHNYPLQIFMELGLLGLVSLLTLVLLVVYAGFRLLQVLKRSESNERSLLIITVGLLAALIGRGVEQMVGVARVGDLVPFWVLMGLLIAVVEITRAKHPEVVEGTQLAGTRNNRSISRNDGRKFVFVGVAFTVTVLAIGLLYYRDVRTVQASALGQDAAELIHEGSPNEALRKLERAAELNPSVELFHLALNDLFRIAANEAEDAGDIGLARFGWESALAAAQRYADRNPLAFDTRSRIGQAQSRLTALGRDDLADAARDTYIDLADAQPSFPRVQSASAQGLLAIGDNNLGRMYAERALEFETPEFPDPRSWRFLGIALDNLREFELASAAYETAIERGPDADDELFLHQRLVLLYGELGKPDKAAEHQAIVDQFE